MRHYCKRRLLLTKMAENVGKTNYAMYADADDHRMYVKGREHKTVRCRMKTQGQQALSWYSNNFLLANPDKFQSLNINPRKLDKDKSDKTLSINDLDVVNTEVIKLLGVHIDENVNFTEHISKLCIKAGQKVGVLSRLQNLIPCKAGQATTVQIFYTAIFNLLSSNLAFLQIIGQ